MVWLLITSVSAFAQTVTPEQLAHQVPLPPAYSGTAMQTVVGDPPGSPPAKFEFDFAIAYDWTAATQYRIDREFGRSPITYEHGTMQESYWYAFSSGWSVSRNTRLQSTGMMGIEQGLSPLPIIRFLRTHPLEASAWTMRIEDDTTVLEIRQKRPGPAQRLYFENGSHRLVRLQMITPQGETASDTMFKDWISVGNDFEVPKTITTSMNPPGDHIVLIVELADLQLVDAATPPPRKPVPTDATIVDEITGVTTRADGSVLDDLKLKPTASHPKSGKRGWLALDTRNLMIAGVALLLAAGAIVGWRRWKAG
ncbi:MAG: hypothetical protein KJZ65_09295 [Phycisphaerales bacterium]|nr:hypothetical protein [Phycisphaerales bacterium]